MRQTLLIMSLTMGMLWPSARAAGAEAEPVSEQSWAVFRPQAGAPVAEPSPLQSGDEIRTTPGVEADLLFREAALIHLPENSTLRVRRVTLDEKTKRVLTKLVSGRAFVKVEPRHFKGTRFAIRTDGAVVSSTGAVFQVSVGTDSLTRVDVASGSVDMAIFIGESRGKPRQGLSQRVEAGESLSIALGSGPGQPSAADPQALERLRAQPLDLEAVQKLLTDTSTEREGLVPPGPPTDTPSARDSVGHTSGDVYPEKPDVPNQ
jgi:hypothetical protein